MVADTLSQNPIDFSFRQGKDRGQLFGRHKMCIFPGIFFTTGQFDLWHNCLPRAKKQTRGVADP